MLGSHQGGARQEEGLTDPPGYFLFHGAVECTSVSQSFLFYFFLFLPALVSLPGSFETMYNWSK